MSADALVVEECGYQHIPLIGDFVASIREALQRDDTEIQKEAAFLVSELCENRGYRSQNAFGNEATLNILMSLTRSDDRDLQWHAAKTIAHLCLDESERSLPLFNHHRYVDRLSVLSRSWDADISYYAICALVGLSKSRPMRPLLRHTNTLNALLIWANASQLDMKTLAMVTISNLTRLPTCRDFSIFNSKPLKDALCSCLTSENYFLQKTAFFAAVSLGDTVYNQTTGFLGDFETLRRLKQDYFSATMTELVLFAEAAETLDLARREASLYSDPLLSSREAVLRASPLFLDSELFDFLTSLEGSFLDCV
jgi:hypothetical protein